MGVELLSQITDIGFDDVDWAVEIHRPYRRQDLCFGQRPPGVAQEVGEKPEFCGCELERSAGPANFVPLEVEGYIGEA